MQILIPDYLLHQGELRSGWAIHLDDDGMIADVGPAPASGGRRLAGRLIIPGFVNGHSHAFQRAIRGRSEYRQPGRERDDFWTWREQMYAAALRLGPEQVEAVSRMVFVEMALAGITTVGEFHYLHHPAEGGRYAEPDELALQVDAAAKRAGLRMVLLRVGYARAGHGRDADPRQVRFIDAGPEETIASVERLRAKGMQVGLAPHSVRALPIESIRTLGAYAQAHGLPLHMHVSEQPREVEESLAEHGATPLEVLAREGLVDERFTGVHGVHLTEKEWHLLGRAAATICACPTTERNLGDGIVPARELLDNGVRLSFGTDSQIEIAPLQDARALEYHLRLQRLQRAILGGAQGDAGPDRMAASLLACATESGARSLGVQAGAIESGKAADLVAFDLDDPSICGADPATLLSTLVFSAERTAIRDVWIGGRQVVVDGKHIEQERAVADFGKAMRALWS
jgi:formimidoylglutamate deiminase